jgi:hypothetical protein
MVKRLWIQGFLFIVLAAAPVAAQGRGKGEGKKEHPKAANQEHAHPQKADKQAHRAGKPVQSKQHKNEHDKVDKKLDRPVHKAEPAAEVEGERGRGKGHGSAKRFKHELVTSEVKPSLHRFMSSSRLPDRVAVGAVARAHARGLREDDIVIVRVGERVHIKNRAGTRLLDLDDRELGGWRVDPIDDDVKSGAPSFCRSGAGHPVWGRQWCLDKGFGLGNDRDLSWGRTTTVPDIIFRRRTDSDRLTGNVLLDVLGDVVFNRLALHAITLGFADPLDGVWLGEPSGPRVLRLSSGGYPVAEIVDANRDDRADVLVVALRPW